LHQRSFAIAERQLDRFGGRAKRRAAKRYAGTQGA